MRTSVTSAHKTDGHPLNVSGLDSRARSLGGKQRMDLDVVSVYQFQTSVSDVKSASSFMVGPQWMCVFLQGESSFFHGAPPGFVKILSFDGISFLFSDWFPSMTD